MTRITEDTVDAVARLARLSLSPDERTRFARELEAIVAWADSLQALDTDGVPPLRLEAADDALRDDTAREGLGREQAVGPAPDQVEGLFRVPRILP